MKLVNYGLDLVEVVMMISQHSGLRMVPGTVMRLNGEWFMVNVLVVDMRVIS